MKPSPIAVMRNLAGTAVVVAALLLLATIAKATPSITWLGSHYPTDCSADGSVVVGNTGDGRYEPFRWTEDLGVVPLDMCTSCVVGTGGGTPDVSDDGNRVSATILTADSTYTTQGIWIKGQGWQPAMPPLPPDGGSIDNGLSSAWGMSGNGDIVVGYYWRPGNGGPGGSGLNWANTWSPVDGFTSLPSPLRNCRANDADYDGSTVVGWSERADGVWQPTVWENGGVTVLADSDTWADARAISNDGNIIVGNTYDVDTGQNSAAMWLRTDTGWEQQFLGVLPGTFPGIGMSAAADVTNYGHMAVGFNQFDQYTFTGIVWTLEEGMVKARDWFTAQGLSLPSTFVIESLTAISHDGRVIVGFGHHTTTFPYPLEGFIVHLDPVSAVPDAGSAVAGLAIESNHPNPFNPSTAIALAVDSSQSVRVEIFDVRGRSVRVVHDGVLSAGRHELQWDGRDAQGGLAASGVYFARAFGADGASAEHRMTLVK